MTVPFFFFFSSRRRHTRCSRDWSSDVCSSDLEPRAGAAVSSRRRRAHPSGRRAPHRGGDRRDARLGGDARRDRHESGHGARARRAAARAPRAGSARRGDRRPGRPRGCARLDRGVRSHGARAGPAFPQGGRPHRDLHRCDARRHARRPRRGRCPRPRRARARRDRLGGCGLARRSAARARRGARGRHRGARAVRGTVHGGRGPGVRRAVSLGLTLLRATALGALILLLWNPAVSRVESGVATPLVLLDASLSMAGQGGGWRAALDTARALAHGGVIWRFGDRVTAFDTLPPADGASRLGPALAAAAARGGPVVVVTDGAITDAADLPPDLARGPRIVVVPRAPFFDAFVASVDGPRHVSAGDTIRLSVSYGTAGPKEAGRGKREGTLIVNLSGRRIASHRVVLPDRGAGATELALPASRIPRPEWTALEVRLEGGKDSRSEEGRVGEE